MNPLPLVRVDNITTGYNGLKVLENVSLDIFKGDFIGIIGPNGGGKTTLIKSILGLMDLWMGKIRFPQGKPRMGYLPQLSQIDKSFPISVKDVIASGLKTKSQIFPRIGKEGNKKISSTIKDLGLESVIQKPIGELSGGQLQKVLLGRAIINQPELLILDEPNTFIDKSFEKELYDWLDEVKDKISILLISHDVGTITPLVKTIACVNGDLHYHHSNQITPEILRVYNCPVDIIAHGPVPHRVLKDHE